MIYAFSFSQCPAGYACRYDENDGLCIRSVCSGLSVDTDSDNKIAVNAAMSVSAVRTVRMENAYVRRALFYAGKAMNDDVSSR